MATRLRNLAFWLLLMLGLGGLYGLAQLATAPIRTESARVASAQSLIDDLRARRATVRAAFSRLPLTAGGVDPRLDAEGSVQDGLQRFQERVRAALTVAGGTPIVSQTGSEAGTENLTTMRLLLRAELSEQGLMGFLKEVESGVPKISIGALEMHKQPGGASDNLELTVTLIMLHADAL
ncbi:MAG: GspMb/PilO family protein [Devosia sp.]